MTAQLLWVILLCLFQITSGISNPFLLTKLSVLVFHIFMITRCGSLWLMPGVAIAFDDFQVAVLMKRDEYEKQINYGLSVVQGHLNGVRLMLSSSVAHICSDSLRLGENLLIFQVAM